MNQLELARVSQLVRLRKALGRMAWGKTSKNLVSLHVDIPVYACAMNCHAGMLVIHTNTGGARPALIIVQSVLVVA